MSANRLNRLYNLMSASKLDAVAVNPGPSLFYLTGLHFHLMERPTILISAPGRESALILPELELQKVKGSLIPVKTFPFADNPAIWHEAFEAACKYMELDGKTLGVEPLRLRFMEFDRLQKASPTTKLVGADELFNQLRLQKDQTEIDAMRQAVRIAQDALKATIPMIKIGASEREIAAELVLQLLRHGSDSELPFQPIVSGGPNAADPHAVPGERRLQKGDLLVVDWGAVYDGYVSDLTRTFAIGEPDAECRKIHQLVLEANAAGRKRAAPDLRAGDVDIATRAVIEKAGYGQYFTHRTGHGIGMEGHEPPYMFAENDLILKPGMAFTVEPGIYLPGYNGVRIEDNVIITETGAETLSDMPRDLVVL